jgi:hypothetical protein
MNVLDKYCEHGWQTDVKELAGFIFYGIGINIPVEAEGAMGKYQYDIQTLWRWDTGARIENNPTDNMFEQAGKSAASDALKRAAVQWGIGRFLYDLPTMVLPCDQYNVLDDKGNKVYDLTKHINGLKKKVTSPITTSATIDNPPSLQNDESKKLGPEAYDNMVKFINDGKIKEVETAMKKYDLTPAQKTVLTSLINQERSKAITKSAKKK